MSYDGLLPGEQLLVPALKRVMTPKVLVDVGCNRGEYTRLLSDNYPEAKIYAFDPLYGTPAVGRTTETREMRVFRNDVFSSAANTWQYMMKGEHVVKQVEVKPLSELVGEDIDFLKIDTEGMEMDVLMGLGDHKPKVLQFEYGLANHSEGHSLATFGQFFWERGYTIWQIDWQVTYGNWIAGPPEVVRELLKCIILSS